MSIQLIVRPTEKTDISHLNKRPSTNDNGYCIEFSQPSSSRTKVSVSSRESQIKNIEIRLHIANHLDIRPDCLILYLKDIHGGLNQLNDIDPFNLTTLNNINNTPFSSTTSSKFNSRRSKTRVIIYFSLFYESRKVMINLFNRNIEKMIFDVSLYCSVYLLKHIISQKASLNIPKENQILYSTGLLSSTNEMPSPENKDSEKKISLNKIYAFKTSTSHKLKDETTVTQIIDYYSHNKGTNNITNPIIDIIFAEKQKDKYQIGLDFSFNIMKTSNKIEFDNSAPSYREVSDGLNLFSYCHNLDCDILNEMFTVKIGYGQYDIIQVCKVIKCPKCKEKTMHEVKNIGMINAQWKYRGILNGHSLSKCEGDGFTIDQKLYVLSEINIMKQFNSLLIEIKPHSNKMKETNVTNINDDQSIKFEDLDAIDLYTPNEERLNKIIEYNLINKGGKNNDSNQLGIKINEPDIIIDTVAKEVCLGCSNDAQADSCIIF